MQMRTPHLSKGFYLLGIALLSMSLIALAFSIFDGERASAVRVTTMLASEHGELNKRERHNREQVSDSALGNIQPSDSEQFMAGGTQELPVASGTKVTINEGERNPEKHVDGGGKSNSALLKEANLPDPPKIPGRSDQNAALPHLPADDLAPTVSGTEAATQSSANPAKETNDERTHQAKTPNFAKSSNQSRGSEREPAGVSRKSVQKLDQMTIGKKAAPDTVEPAYGSQREGKSFTLAGIELEQSPFRFAIGEQQSFSDNSFALISDALRQQMPDKDETTGLPLSSVNENLLPSLFSPVVITGLPARMQNASTGDLPSSELVRKQPTTDFGTTSFSDQANSLTANETPANTGELTEEAPIIPESESSKSPTGLINANDSLYEPLVSRPVEDISSQASDRGGETQPRLAMLQAPSPSSPKSDTAKEPESETEKTETPMPKKEAEDDEEHMISELVGGCYGCFSRVLDSGLYASNEFTFLSTSSIGDVRIGVTDMLSSTTTSESTKSGIGFGNRTTLGIRGAFAGLRATYWTFDANEEVTDYGETNQAMPRFVSASGVDAETVDLEITQPFCIFGCRFESSVGARYANYRANDTLVLVDQMHNSLELTGIAKSSREINGAGPTLALAGRKNLRIGFWGQPGGEFLPDFECAECGSSSCLGECNTWRSCHGCFPWNIYWNGRISWLWADETGAALTEASVFQHDGNANIASARSRDKAVITDDADSSIYTLSFQIGLEYCRPIFCRSQCVIRAGFEYQHWDLGKNVAESQSFAFLTDNSNFGGRVDSIAQSSKNYVDLAGFTLMLGLNY